MEIKNDINIDMLKKDDIILFNKIMGLKNNITDFNIYYDNLINQENFKTNILFSDVTTSKLWNYFKRITIDLNNLIGEDYTTKFNLSEELMPINCFINKYLIMLKELLIRLRKRMTSSGNYLNINHNYHNAFPLGLFNDIEFTIINLENKLNISLIEVLN